jgi:hypothetical protein
VGRNAEVGGAGLPAAPDPPELELGLGLGLGELSAAGELTPALGERTASPVCVLDLVTTRPAAASKAIRNRLKTS